MSRARRVGREAFSLRFRWLKTASLILLGLVIWLAFNIQSLRRFLHAYHMRNLQRANVEALREKVAQLRAQKESLEKGSFENEKAVREAYRLVRPGEKLILLAPETEESSAAREGSE